MWLPLPNDWAGPNHMATPGAREVGNVALNSECIQPKFRGSTTEDKDRIRVWEPLKLFIVKFI